MAEPVAKKSPRPRAQRARAQKIPAGFIYEVLDGKPIYYSGYREALANQLPPEHVIGSGRRQAYLIDLILGFLKSSLDRTIYATAVSEPGVKFGGKKDNVANDIIIYHAADKQRMFTDEYFDFPPHVVVEVDTKAELADLSAGVNQYLLRKTERLLEFGVSKVLWVFTDMRKIMIAEKDRPWLTVDWEVEVEVLPGCTLSLRQLIEADGVDVETFFPKPG